MLSQSRRLFLTGIAVIMGALYPLGSSAQAATQANAEGDAECMLLSNFFSKSSTDQKSKDTATMAQFFYVGRLNGEVPAPAMSALIAGASKKIVPNLAGASMKACAETFVAATQQVEVAGRSAKIAPAK